MEKGKLQSLHCIHTYIFKDVSILFSRIFFFFLLPLLKKTTDMLRDTSLGELYKNIFPGIGKQLHRSRFVHLPQIIHAQDNEKYLNSPDLSHEAGFDAFMSGTVFIYLAHTMAGLNYL